MDSLPNFLTHGAPLCARFARARSSAITRRRYSLLTTLLVSEIKMAAYVLSCKAFFNGKSP